MLNLDRAYHIYKQFFFITNIFIINQFRYYIMESLNCFSEIWLKVRYKIQNVRFLRLCIYSEIKTGSISFEFICQPFGHFRYINHKTSQQMFLRLNLCYWIIKLEIYLLADFCIWYEMLHYIDISFELFIYYDNVFFFVLLLLNDNLSLITIRSSLNS